MKALIAFISHNRLAYTQKSLRSLRATLTIDHQVICYDNASTDGTAEWLQDARSEGLCDALILSDTNDYPGKAANSAWAEGLTMLMPDADLLVRVDNDMLFSEGWDVEMAKAFENHLLLGQLGLLNQSQCFPGEPNRVKAYEQNGYAVNRWWSSIGGTMAMRRDLWDMGIRYEEVPWRSEHADQPTPQEDVRLSLAIQETGFFFANTLPNLTLEMSFGETDDYYDYYVKTFTDRGHAPPPRTKSGEVIGDDGQPVSGSTTLAGDHI